MIGGFHCPQFIRNGYWHKERITDELETAFLLQLQLEKEFLPVHINPVPVDPPVPDVAEVIGHQKKVGGVNELPVREIGQEIRLVTGQNHSRSHWERRTGSSV